MVFSKMLRQWSHLLVPESYAQFRKDRLKRSCSNSCPSLKHRFFGLYHFTNPRTAKNPRIADIGCGAGAGTLFLADKFRSKVRAVGISRELLDELEDRAKQKRLEHLVETIECDMGRLDWKPETIDLLWSERAAYNLTFKGALTAWRPLMAANELDMKTKYTPHTPRLKIVDQYIRDLFRDELPSSIKYHDANHTLHPTKGVVAVANRIAISEGISEEDRELLITAAYFHDTGYIREYEKNEPIAARMAGRILKLIGYKSNEIERVQGMILATDLDREPKTHVEKILCDADLDNLGREDFLRLDGRLREGRGARGVDVSDDVKWYRGTLELIKNHQYYTQSQKKLRGKGKQKNLKRLLDKLENIENR